MKQVEYINQMIILYFLPFKLHVDTNHYTKGMKVKIKVGHGGTLDPLAEGVLVIGECFYI